jgi:hypothetical protein
MLSVITLSVIMLSVTQNFILLSISLVSVIMVIVIVQNFKMLSVIMMIANALTVMTLVCPFQIFFCLFLPKGMLPRKVYFGQKFDQKLNSIFWDKLFFLALLKSAKAQAFEILPKSLFALFSEFNASIINLFTIVILAYRNEQQCLTFIELHYNEILEDTIACKCRLMGCDCTDKHSSLL